MKPKNDPTNLAIHRLGPGDDTLFHGMLGLFAAAFDDTENYSTARPGLTYRKALLSRDDVVMLVALDGQNVAGALVAYELRKFEQERSELYIYDLAVTEAWRRRGVATAMIDNLKTIAKTNGHWVVYVQADYGDEPAIALYTKLGTCENVMHFNIALDE
ncbi:MAG: AAC(3)-I family aminoglycoside N-acetyltransferase [Rhizobiaceae bacterium]|nr:AAC(3)-I family aminoglycoside N-acetyltransferase [Rhizobiaceae bacterium]